MGLFEIIAILLTISAAFSFINYRFLKLPTTIGLMLIALVFSLVLILAGKFIPNSNQWAIDLLQKVDFDETLLHGMLSFLLFAGALHVNLNDLKEQYRIITGLATAGVIISTFVVGGLSWLLLNLLNMNFSFFACLLFGALISPTDPIAVLGIIKTTNTPKSLETKITGESLFNDGVGVVVFLVLLDIATPGHGEVGMLEIGRLFLLEAFGGAALGLAAGLLTYWLLKNVDSYQVEVLITLALVTGSYALAEALHLSAPIAIVVAGLLIGNHGRSFAMSATTREHLDTFWELVDEILNAVLFVLIGLEVMVLTSTGLEFIAGLLAIPVVLFARLVSVVIPITILRFFRTFSPHVVKILTWAGLRGGISVALALSLPVGHERQVILTLTYIVVVFSIAVQGLTVGRVVQKLIRS